MTPRWPHLAYFDISHRLLCNDEQQWSLGWQLANVLSSTCQCVHWHLSLMGTFLSVMNKELMKHWDDRKLKAKQYLNCAALPSDTQGHVNLSQREQKLCLLKVWADSKFPLEAKPVCFLFTALQYESLPALAIFNLHHFSDLICILPHAPFQSREVVRYDTGVGKSEQRISPGFQIISEVKIRRERTLSFQILS